MPNKRINLTRPRAALRRGRGAPPWARRSQVIRGALCL